MTLASLCLCVFAPAGCVVVPDPLPEPSAGAPLLHIVKQNVDPSLDDTPPIDRNSAAVFDVVIAIEVRGTTGALHYGWYGDVQVGSGIPLQYYRTNCDDQPRCFLNPCTGFLTASDNHKLLLVVSDTPLPPAALTQFDFPAGAAFDWVEWQVELTGVCPK